MVSKYKELNIFLADLAVMNIKVHNLHWNVVGTEFKSIHKMTEKIYEMIQEQFDEVAEIMKMHNQFPFARITDYKNNTNIEEVESRPYQTDEVLEILNNDYDKIINQANKAREEASTQGNFLIVNLMEDYLKNYVKNSWMMRAILEEEPRDFE